MSYHRAGHRDHRLVGCLVVLLLARPALAEDPESVKFSGESPAVKLRLDETRQRLDERKWSEAIEALQTILNTMGNDLVRIDPALSIQAGQLCRLRLASLPADALQIYRRRYEEPASKKLQQAQEDRDVTQLRKLVEDSFCTRAAEKAMDRLGDLAFERGKFEEAEHWWRLLSPLPDARREFVTRDFALVYPDLHLDPARVQAKQLLARLFQGMDDDWKSALDAYRKRHAQAEGTLAGRRGRYTDLLHALAAERKDQRSEIREGWLTFGGDPSRGQPLPASEDILDRLSALCRDGPTWTFPLEPNVRQKETDPAPAISAKQALSLAFHPVIVGHQVLVSDARYVTAFDVRDGTSEEWYDVRKLNAGGELNLKLPAPPDLRYTLTVAGDHVYARLGAQNIGYEAPNPQRRQRGDEETFLASFRLRPEEGGHFRWQIRGIVHDDSLFEGAPLAAEGLIWIAATRYQGNRCITSIDCYTANDTSEPPLRWRCDVCESGLPKAGEPRFRHHLLTLAGSQIVYCSHTGAVVAIDALTGRRNWAMRYPKRALQIDEVDLRDLSPVLAAGGRLFVAPDDSDTLLCLDAASGRSLWELEPPARVVHLLGVGQGRLLFTTPKGLRAVRVDNGDPVWAVPDAGGGLTPAGRGLLIGDLVLFPTTQHRGLGSPVRDTVVYAIRQSDGRAADDPARLHRLPAGNLAYGNGCLAVTDQQTLSIFVPPRMLLAKRQAQAQRQPDSAGRLVELAHAEADAGQIDNALRTLRLAESKAQQLSPSSRNNLLARLYAERQGLLLKMARSATRDQRWDDAESAFEQARAVPLGPRGQLHALLHAARIWQDAGESDRERAIWKAVLADEQLREIQVIDRNRIPMSAADSAAARLAATRRGARQNNAPLRVAAKRRDSPSLPLLRTWHAQLDNEEWILARWRDCDPELLLTGSPAGHIICRDAGTGAIRWQSRLPIAPHWAACHEDTTLIGGDEGVACLHREDGRRIWHFPAPRADLYPHSPIDEVRVALHPQPPEPLTVFQLVGERLYFLQGQRRLIALDARSGAVLWQRWSPDGKLHLPFPSGCFSSCYYAGTETVLLQAPGHRYLVEATTGRQLHQDSDSRDPWRRSPLALDEQTWCVVPDARHVLAVDARTGQCQWQHESPGGTTLSGEPPAVLGRGDLLLFLQPANIGYYLDRLDRATGKSVWPRPRLLTAKSLDVSCWSFDSDAVYTIEDGVLVARSLTDGGVLWRRPLQDSQQRILPTDSWEVRREGDYLAVWPRDAVTLRFRFRSLLGPLQWNLGSLRSPEALFPLSFYDPKTGQLMQRLNLRIESSPRTTLAKRRTLEEGAPTWIVQTSSLLASEDGPVIRLDGPHPFVAVGGEVWGLTSFSGEP